MEPTRTRFYMQCKDLGLQNGINFPSFTIEFVISFLWAVIYGVEFIFTLLHE